MTTAAIAVIGLVVVVVVISAIGDVYTVVAVVVVHAGVHVRIGDLLQKRQLAAAEQRHGEHGADHQMFDQYRHRLRKPSSPSNVKCGVID